MVGEALCHIKHQREHLSTLLRRNCIAYIFPGVPSCPESPEVPLLSHDSVHLRMPQTVRSCRNCQQELLPYRIMPPNILEFSLRADLLRVNYTITEAHLRYFWIEPI